MQGCEPDLRKLIGHPNRISAHSIRNMHKTDRNTSASTSERQPAELVAKNAPLFLRRLSPSSFAKPPAINFINTQKFPFLFHVHITISAQFSDLFLLYMCIELIQQMVKLFLQHPLLLLPSLLLSFYITNKKNNCRYYFH